jgi:adenylosuccinate synthase
MEQMEDAVTLNDPTDIALTFCDYLEPRIHGESGTWFRQGGAIDPLKGYPAVQALVDTIEAAVQVPVTMLGTGPQSVINIKRG